MNRCTDRTEEIARSYDCVIIKEDRKNMSIIRNAGAKVARGEIIATIDADSRMTDNMLTEIEEKLQTGKYIGGGVMWKFDKRPSSSICAKFSTTLATFFVVLILIPLLIKFRCSSCGIFWCYKRDFESINGFNEDQRMLNLLFV